VVSGKADPAVAAASAPSLAEALNRSCRCVSVNPAKLRTFLEGGEATAGLYASILAQQPNLFAASPVFVSRNHVESMQATIDAVEAVVALPAYRERVLSWAPEIARHDQGPRGVLFGYDFHLGPAGPQLIEINTNAGGALLNAALARAQQACCEEVDALVAGPRGAASIDDEMLRMFRSEWALARGDAPLSCIAIVDDDPAAQYLHPEFLLFRDLFERAGIEALVVDAAALSHAAGVLRCGERAIDLVYNRLTDFHLAGDSCRALREAYLAGSVVVTPHPRAYALYADKRNLTVLSDEAELRRLGAAADVAATLAIRVPRTWLVDPARADTWWRERKRYFFKPIDGYGGKAAYRGDKLTRSAWAAILARPYVAQVIVPPSERTIEVGGQEVPLKLDLRNYVYQGQVQLLAARLYQGQTTNFRTAGGGFAPVFTEMAPAAAVACEGFPADTTLGD
jgi:hypothetical protein